MATAEDIFSGIWHCAYWYPSNNHDGEDVSEYGMAMHRTGDKLVLESLPNPEEAYMLVNLQLDEDGELATGTWHETTSPHGEFKGAIYSGAGQLLFDDDKHELAGKWAGIGYDYDQAKQAIYSGKWQITYVRPA
jgi:hypothetical protein